MLRSSQALFERSAVVKGVNLDGLDAVSKRIHRITRDAELERQGGNDLD